MQDPTVMQGALSGVPLVFISLPCKTAIFHEQNRMEAPMGPAAFWPRGVV